ncbi:MAG: SCO family protein [Flavobacteriales bacterium]
MNRLIAFLIVLILGVLAVYFLNRNAAKNKPLPVISPADVNPLLVDESIQRKKGGHYILDFALTDQRGRTFSKEMVEGKIVVVNFFFTTCPTICPAMNSQLKRVYEVYKNHEEIFFLSHTVMPEIDSSEILFQYAERLGVNHDKWIFLTGSKEELYRLARKSYLAAPAIGDKSFSAHAEGNDFVHTENLVLVDRKGRIRGLYDGLNKIRVDELIADLSKLIVQEN